MFRIALDLTTIYAAWLAFVCFFNQDWEHIHIPGIMFLVLAAAYAIIGDKPKKRRKN